MNRDKTEQRSKLEEYETDLVVETKEDVENFHHQVFVFNCKRIAPRRITTKWHPPTNQPLPKRKAKWSLTFPEQTVGPFLVGICKRLTKPKCFKEKRILKHFVIFAQVDFA